MWHILHMQACCLFFTAGLSQSVVVRMWRIQVADSACRLRCADIARGCTVALMLFVNHVGKEPEWIAHAPWNGLHLADLVMPCFLLIVGMSAALSLTAGRKRGAATSDLLQRVLSRAGMPLLRCYATPLFELLWLCSTAFRDRLLMQGSALP